MKIVCQCGMRYTARMGGRVTKDATPQRTQALERGILAALATGPKSARQLRAMLPGAGIFVTDTCYQMEAKGLIWRENKRAPWRLERDDDDDEAE